MSSLIIEVELSKLNRLYRQELMAIKASIPKPNKEQTQAISAAENAAFDVEVAIGIQYRRNHR